MSLIAETMLFLTIRAENIDKIIRPTLNSGTWVVCDRFMDSTYV
jgi:dTMP kinase